MSHKIILPNPKYFDGRTRADYRISEFAKCMKILEVYETDIKVIEDTGKLKEAIPEYVQMANDNGKYSSFFMVDGHLFMIIDTDHPVDNHEEWVKHHESKGVKGYFVWCHRHSTKYIFDGCKASIFPLAGKPGPLISLKDMEHEAHPRSVNMEKDINVFFHGRFNTRPTRESIAPIITDAIPNCRIGECSKEYLSSEEYINFMSRSKIVWCPRSVWSEPNRECNAPTGKEFEAMCLEVLVLKPPIGTIEVEERIPGVHFVEVHDHSLDLIEKIQYYLEHEDERKEIAHNGRLWYERNCTVNSRAYYLFNSALKAIKQ